jgi:hypothetical protein
MDDAFAKQVEAGAAIHLPLDRLDPVDVALGGAGAVAQGDEPGGDRGQVLADPGGEGVRFGLVVGFDALKPAGQLLFPVRRVIILAKLVTCPASRSSWAQWPRRSAGSCC